MTKKKANRARDDWQQWLVIIIIVSVLLASLTTLVVLGYVFGWNSIGVIEYSYKADGTIEGVTGIKTLWDWLDLLLVPAFIAFGIWWLNRLEARAREERDERDRKSREQRENLERELAADRRNQATLESYLDRMTDLILGENRRSLWTNADVRDTVRTRTLATLRSLDGKRKSLVIEFLWESGLITRSGEDFLAVETEEREEGDYTSLPRTDTLYLFKADLREADLRAAWLPRVFLLGVDLSDATLVRAKLSGADLRFSNLGGADLTGADLSGASLQGAMYDDETKWPKEFDPSAVGAEKVARDS